MFLLRGWEKDMHLLEAICVHSLQTDL